MRKYKHTLAVIIKGSSFNKSSIFCYSYYITTDHTNTPWFPNSFRIIKII